MKSNTKTWSYFFLWSDEKYWLRENYDSTRKLFSGRERRMTPCEDVKNFPKIPPAAGGYSAKK